MLRADETGAVVAVLVEVEFVGDVVLMQGGGEELSVLHGDQFVLHRVPEEDGRQAGLHLQFAGSLADEFFIG